MTTLAFALITARRAWYVPDVTVTGDYSAMTVEMLVGEADDSEGRIVLYCYPIGGVVQEVVFGSLVDHRGNALPATINRPVVIPIPRNDVPVAVVGQPSAATCRLARTRYVAHDGLVDLWIVEAGREGE